MQFLSFDCNRIGFELHSLTMLANRPNILVSALYSAQLILVLRKHLVAGQFSLFSFSLLLIGHHQ